MELVKIKLLKARDSLLGGVIPVWKYVHDLSARAHVGLPKQTVLELSDLAVFQVLEILSVGSEAFHFCKHGFVEHLETIVVAMERNAKTVIKEFNREILATSLSHVPLFTQVLVESIDPKTEENFSVYIGGKATVNSVN